MTVRILVGDCRMLMAVEPENSVDAIVCDPPYGLEFMSVAWDSFATPKGSPRTPNTWGDHGSKEHPRNATSSARIAGNKNRAFQDWSELWATQALRILKPGGHLVAFGGTRTFHRLTCAIEDAGFEIRDVLSWLYGSGFPKSLDVSKAIDKAAGAQRTVLSEGTPVKRMIPGADQNATGSWIKDNGRVFVPTTSAPATPAAQEWTGWGTALKPAWEPIILARKPLSEPNVAANVLRWGTGALNIAGCRLEFRSVADEQESKQKNRHADFGSGPRDNKVYGDDLRDRAATGNYNAAGRWPANVALDEEVAEMLDEQSGITSATGRRSAQSRAAVVAGTTWGTDNHQSTEYPGDSGGASRFFYTAKASRSERNKGLEGMPTEALGVWGGKEDDLPEGMGRSRPAANSHPTVKPLDLMRWLVRMVTPPGGTVCDPFMGSGSTGIAANREGFGFLGMEQDAGYAELARRRIVGDNPMFVELTA